MRVTGAVLDEIGRPRPFAVSRPLTIGEVELAPPRAGEVLVRIETAGLCHSDLSVVDGNRVRPVPMLLGHEAAGVVVELGSGVGDLHVGQRVVMTFLPRCGDCAGCRTDGIRPCIPGSTANGAGELLAGGSRLQRDGDTIHHHLGVSGFATHAVVDRRSVVPVAPDVPAEVAALLGCAVLTGGGAVINVARPQPGDRIAVVGLGGVGMAALLTALAYDDVDVIAVDMAADKLQAARELGAAQVMTPEEAMAGGVTARVVIEAAGVIPALRTAVAMTAPGGTTITVGLPAPEAKLEISPTDLVAQGRSLVGSYLGSSVASRDVPVFVDLWRRGRLPVERLVSARITLAEVNAGLDLLADGRAIRTLIVFNEPPA